MRFGIASPNVEPFGDPTEAARLAGVAEDAGWDGFFVWDVLGFLWDEPGATFDPWVILSAVAVATKRLRLGTDVAALARYQPHLLAMTLTSLDHLSEGRMILGAGIGFFERELSAFGQPSDPPTRAEKTDEGLEIMTRLWSGEELTYRGKHHTVDAVTLSPIPLQRPRIPVWIGGDSPPALRRAARWDGWCGPTSPWETWTPDDLRAFRRTIEQERQSAEPFDIAWGGFSTPKDRNLVEDYRQAGATWWIEVIDSSRGSFNKNLDRVAQGPPR